MCEKLFLGQLKGAVAQNEPLFRGAHSIFLWSLTITTKYFGVSGSFTILWSLPPKPATLVCFCSFGQVLQTAFTQSKPFLRTKRLLGSLRPPKQKPFLRGSPPQVALGGSLGAKSDSDFGPGPFGPRVSQSASRVSEDSSCSSPEPTKHQLESRLTEARGGLTDPKQGVRPSSAFFSAGFQLHLGYVLKKNKKTGGGGGCSLFHVPGFHVGVTLFLTHTHFPWRILQRWQQLNGNHQ